MASIQYIERRHQNIRANLSEKKVMGVIPTSPSVPVALSMTKKILKGFKVKLLGSLLFDKAMTSSIQRETERLLSSVLLQIQFSSVSFCSNLTAEKMNKPRSNAYGFLTSQNIRGRSQITLARFCRFLTNQLTMLSLLLNRAYYVQGKFGEQ